MTKPLHPALISPPVQPSIEMPADAPPEPSPAQPQSPGSPEQPFTWAETIARIYARILRPIGSTDPARIAIHRSHAHALLQELAPQDAIEQLLAGQLVLLQARIQFLNMAAVMQEKTIWSQLYSSQLEGATAAYQKVQQSLLDHRRPRRRRRSGSFTTIRTAHITAQQLIGVPLPTQAPHALQKQSPFTEADTRSTKSITPEAEPAT